MCISLLCALVLLMTVGMLPASGHALSPSAGLVITSMLLYFALANSLVMLVYGGRRSRAFAMSCLPLQVIGAVRVSFLPAPVWQEPMLDTTLQSLSVQTAPESVALILLFSWMCGCVGLLALASCQRGTVNDQGTTV